MIEEKPLKILEFDKILAKLSGHVQSDTAKAAALAQRPAARREDAEKLLFLTREADKVLFEFSLSPSFAVDDLSNALALAKKYATLSIAEILKVGRCLAASRRIKTALSKANGIALLSALSQNLYADQKFEEEIFAAFLSDAEVSDNASRELRDIRARIRKKNAAIKSTLSAYISSAEYSKYIQDNIVTIRGDRYVIPVKSEHKGAIAGLVHDQSSSGSTLYVEPMSVVNLNNELKSLLAEEQAEIERILRAFSVRITEICDALSRTFQTIVETDVIFAKAKLAKAQKAAFPVLNENGELNIVNGRHPLIDAKTVVPVSIKIQKDVKMLLITGPNTGGKTVTLKLIGLFCLMAYSGMFVPASEADIPLFDSIFCDIGDEQSIEQSLSTFSAHIKNITEIIDSMTKNSLLLLDELGAGTDPSEGAALAVSLADFILKFGAKSVLTSHFNDLKEFALSQKNVATASMDFDAQTFAPTYKLIMGAVGSSNALKIASRLGLRGDIIADAKSRISKEKREFDNVLASAENTRKRAESIISQAETDKKEAERLLREAEQEKNIIAQKREKLDETIRKETKKLIENSVEEANEIIAELRDMLERQKIEEADIFRAAKLRKQLENMTAKYDEESAVAPVLDEKATPKVGDKVYVKSLKNAGELLSVSPRGEAEVRLGKLTVKVKNGDYAKVIKG
jgi:DNA mismatch repair protein MutS2